jgi:protein O-GlcNAc transferase
MSAAPPTLAERALRHQRAGEAGPAEAIWRHLAATEPDNALPRFHLGTLLGGLGRLSEAETWLAEAVARAPDSPELLGNLGMIRQRLGRLDDAVDCYRRALARPGDLAVIYNNLGGALQELGQAEESLAAYRRADASLRNPMIAANVLTTLNLLPGTRAQFLAAARDWAQRFAEPLTPARPSPRGSPPRLRVGYVGAGGLRRHTLALTWLPLLEAHDAGRVEVFAYSDLPLEREDDISRRFQAVSTWRRTAGLDDENLAALIRSDAIDILVDGIGFAAGSRLTTFARRPAPLQVHFPPMSTTGMSAMDAIIGDEVLIPPGSDADYTEAVYRLPCGFLYAPLAQLPPPEEAPAARNGFVTFGSFSRPAKISPAAIAAWAKILSAVPSARLRVKSGAALADSTIAAFRDQFAQHGADPARVEFRGRVPSDAEHYRALLDIDIALDTFPHGGVLTTCDALVMGVPVVTWAGERVLERYGAALLQAAGFSEGIAGDIDQYVHRAVSLARDTARLATLRPALAAATRASPLCDARRFASTLEDAYETLTRRLVDRV